MNASLKYVIFNVQGMEVPVIFPDVGVKHDQVELFIDREASGKLSVIPCKAVSAAFFDPRTGQVSGESTSLGLQARPQDSQLICRMLTSS